LRRPIFGRVNGLTLYQSSAALTVLAKHWRPGIVTESRHHPDYSGVARVVRLLELGNLPSKTALYRLPSVCAPFPLDGVTDGRGSVAADQTSGRLRSYRMNKVDILVVQVSRRWRIAHLALQSMTG